MEKELIAFESRFEFFSLSSRRNECGVTIKASNFAPLGNVGHILAISVASLDEFCEKLEKKKILHIDSFSATIVASFFCRTRLMIASPSKSK
jgi:hypothetical protein